MDAAVKRGKLEELLNEVAQGVKLNQAGHFAEAKAVLLKARSAALAWDHRSAFLDWQLGIAYDGMGNLVLAVHLIGSALKMDNFVPPFRSSFEIVVSKARAAMHALLIHNTGIRALYFALVKVDGAGVDDHLLAARHYHQGQDESAALAAVDAALKLAPDYGPAQMTKALVMSGLRWHVEDTKEEAALTFAQVLGAGLPKAEA